MNNYYPCYDDLINHLLDFMQMPEDFESLLVPHLTRPITYTQHTLVLKPGDVAKFAYWPVDGYLRIYKKYQPETDREFFKQKTIEISLPGRIYLPADSYMNETAVDYYLEIVKGSTMVAFSHLSFISLGEQIPEVFLLAGKVMAAAEKDWHKKMEMCKVTSWEGYLQFLEHFDVSVKDFIAQQHIASYIGISAEELSRLKHKDN